MPQSSIQQFYKPAAPVSSPAIQIPVPAVALPPFPAASSYPPKVIFELRPGPGKFKTCGTVVQLYHCESRSQAKGAAAGFFRLKLQDSASTQFLNVKLFYSCQESYILVLGMHVAVYSTHVTKQTESAGGHNHDLATAVFPEKDGSCYFEICEIDTPLTMQRAERHLSSLKDVLNGKGETENVAVFVCVKGIGKRLTITKHKGTENETILEKLEIVVADQSVDATTLTVWGYAINSALQWKPLETVLLLTNPGLTEHKEQNSLSIKADTLINVDPGHDTAAWLRRWMKSEAKKRHVNPEIEEGTYDFDTAKNAESRILFNLAQMNDCAKSSPGKVFMGFFSLVLCNINLVNIARRKVLFSNECCNKPIYSNLTLAQCSSCMGDVELRINSKVIGSLIDESGCLTSSSLTWARLAWEQMFGRMAHDLAACDLDTLQELQDRLEGLRCCFLLGWRGPSGVDELDESEGVIVVGDVLD